MAYKSADLLPKVAQEICKEQKFKPKYFERLNGSEALFALTPDVEDYHVLRVWNAKKQIYISAVEMLLKAIQ